MVEQTGFEPAATVCGARNSLSSLSLGEFRPRHRAYCSLYPPPAALANAHLVPHIVRDERRRGETTQLNEKQEMGKCPSPAFGRDDRIRTCGLFVPNEARYQTALHLDIYFCTNAHLGEWRDSDILVGATNAPIGADALQVAPLRYISIFIFVQMLTWENGATATFSWGRQTHPSVQTLCASPSHIIIVRKRRFVNAFFIANPKFPRQPRQKH